MWSLTLWITICVYPWFGLFGLIFHKFSQFPKYPKTGITRPSDALCTWVRPHFMWNVELNTANDFQRITTNDLGYLGLIPSNCSNLDYLCIPAHDLGYLGPVSLNSPNAPITYPKTINQPSDGLYSWVRPHWMQNVVLKT